MHQPFKRIMKTALKAICIDVCIASTLFLHISFGLLSKLWSICFSKTHLRRFTKYLPNDVLFCFQNIPSVFLLQYSRTASSKETHAVAYLLLAALYRTPLHCQGVWHAQKSSPRKVHVRIRKLIQFITDRRDWMSWKF